MRDILVIALPSAVALAASHFLFFTVL